MSIRYFQLKNNTYPATKRATRKAAARKAPFIAFIRFIRKVNKRPIKITMKMFRMRPAKRMFSFLRRAPIMFACFSMPNISGDVGATIMSCIPTAVGPRRTIFPFIEDSDAVPSRISNADITGKVLCGPKYGTRAFPNGSVRITLSPSLTDFVASNIISPGPSPRYILATWRSIEGYSWSA